MKPTDNGTLAAPPMWIAALANLALALLQLLLFFPIVSEGRSLDLPIWPSAYFEPLFRVDGLSLTFGVAWALAAALAATSLRHAERAWPLLNVLACLISVGLLLVAYARHPLVLYLGWETAGLGLWLSLRSLREGGAPRWLPLVLHLPGVSLLLLILIGAVYPFAPPFGGAGQQWALPVVMAFALVVLLRSGCWPFGGWLREVERASGGKGTPLLGLYAMAAPYLLAKALVAAPWDALGIWVLTLSGTVVLAGSVATAVLTRTTYISVAAGAYTGAALIGFALAPGAPLAAAGAVAILLSGVLWLAAWAGVSDISATYRAPMLLMGAVPGVWLIAQGALSLRYGLAAAILLPAMLLAALAAGPTWVSLKLRHTKAKLPDTTPPPLTHHASRITYHPPPIIAIILLLLSALYPQVAVEGVLRPVVQAMAGGVSALAGVSSDWGVGMSVMSPDGVALAALPATGIGLAVFLAMVSLYWLKRLAARLLRRHAGPAPE
ncbi:MAG TPA: hypothetical protein VEX13_13500 [Chloroflexia bacterium]|nr:hypothetical protein [Chloroflexia bacterium]